ncbi:MAG TPA: NBR1-Ig-like domain-containing protein [Anaerolineales bacterium]|nr:NBR1-Ig-like domain-containing protein [Anaerolineales bacterium]
MKKHAHYFVSASIIAVLLLSACGAASTPPPPTATPVDIPAIYTQAAQTVIAQFTEQAPTITPTPAFTNTPLLPTATVAIPTPTVQKCEDSTFVSDVTIPDNTQMAVNQHFTKTWEVQNTGTCTWITTFYLGFSYGEQMGGPAKVPFKAAVAVGQTVDVSVNLVVPNKTGKLTGVWSLYDNKGNNFGKLLTVVISVGAANPTATAGATATSAASATNSPAPSETLTPTP